LLAKILKEFSDMRDLLLVQAKRLKNQIQNISGNVHYEIGIALNDLRGATLNLVKPDNLEQYSSLIRVLKIDKHAPYIVLKHQAVLVSDQIISVLEHLPGESRCKSGEIAVTRVLPETKRVFIVHGHDMENALRLHARLKDRFRLEPVILSEEPSKGRSIIEKFEAEATTCSFAFVLFTPDDFINKNNETYSQARPNVILELGWFYGRLGRDRVCILFRKGTAIPSDLGGIGRIEFGISIDENIIEIENELDAGGLLRR
jgi:predicted nucleotide-binding protein